MKRPAAARATDGSDMLPIRPRRNVHDIVAIGASAGGVEAVSDLVSLLPRDLAAAVLIVMHRDPGRTSHLHQVLSRRSKLKIVIPDEGYRLEEGVCIVSTPERHLTIGPGLQVHLMPDHFYRSHNVDALFNSLARNGGSRTIGVILSGLLKDGTAGLKAIKESGGIALVQSPEEAGYSDMPDNAIRHNGSIDMIAPIARLAKEISRLAGHAKSNNETVCSK
jgi:two-component system chemotaxis response regulator CheB